MNEWLNEEATYELQTKKFNLNFSILTLSEVKQSEQLNLSF